MSSAVVPEPASESSEPAQIAAPVMTTDTTNRAFLQQLVTEPTFRLNYPQELVKRIDFLMYLHRNSQTKLLTVDQVNILWECLVVNAFNEAERDQFFAMLHELLAIHMVAEARGLSDFKEEAADDLLFSEDTFELVFFEVILRVDFNAKGVPFTMPMYQALEAYFIYVN